MSLSISVITDLQRCAAELRAANERLTDAERERAALAARRRSVAEVIEKPKGCAGGGKRGYNLQRAMMLEDDKPTYSFILVRLSVLSSVSSS